MYGGQGTFASSGRARIASLTRVPVRSTGKEPSPEDGPPAQTGVFTKHYLSMQALCAPCLTNLLLCTQAAPLPTLRQPKKKKKRKQKNRVNNAGAPQTLLTRQIQQMQQLLKNSKV